MVNTLLVILVVIAVIAYIAYKIKENQKAEVENAVEQDDQTYTLDKMMIFIKKRLDEITKVNLYDIGLSEEELKRRKAKKYELKKALKGCTYGDVNDKKYVARSLNMNDIEMYYKDKSDSWKQDTLGFENFNKTGVEATSYQYYPSLYAMEKGSSMDGKVGLSESPNNYDSYNNSYKSDATSTKNYLDTYYRAYTKEIKENYTNDKAYNIIFESGKAYFVATRSVSFYENKMSVYEKEKGQRDKSASAKFGIRAITSDALTQFILMNSGSKPDAFKKYMYPTRPVVVVPKSEIDL